MGLRISRNEEDCPTCNGEGEVIRLNEVTMPASEADLPLRTDGQKVRFEKKRIHLMAGRIRPITCPQCFGLGKVPIHCDASSFQVTAPRLSDVQKSIEAWLHVTK